MLLRNGKVMSAVEPVNKLVTSSATIGPLKQYTADSVALLTGAYNHTVRLL